MPIAQLPMPFLTELYREVGSNQAEKSKSKLQLLDTMYAPPEQLCVTMAQIKVSTKSESIKVLIHFFPEEEYLPNDRSRVN